MVHRTCRARGAQPAHEAWRPWLCLIAAWCGSGAALAAAALPVDFYRFADSPLGIGAVGTHALGVPPPNAVQGADLRLLNFTWAGHKAVVGVAVQPAGSPGGEPGSEPGASVPGPVTAYQFGVYAQDEWQLAPSLAATLGLRIDRHSTGTTQHRPRAALAWRAAPGTLIKALYGRSLRTHGVGERSDEQGLGANPLRRLEAAETFEVDAEQQVARNLKLHAVLYAWTLRDVSSLALDKIGGLPQVQAGQTVEARGLELSADQHWVAAGVRLRGSASLQDAAGTDGKPLLSSPQLLGKLLLSAPLPWAGMHLGYEWLYDDDRIALDGRTLGAYARSNLTLGSTEWVERVACMLSVQNLFDARDARWAAAAKVLDAVEPARRSVQVRLAYSF